MIHAMNEEANQSSGRLLMLRAERDARQKELEADLRAIAQLQSSMGIPMIGETPLDTGEAQHYREQLANAERELEDAQNAQSEIEGAILRINAYIENGAKKSAIYEFEVEDRVSSDSRVSALRQGMVMAQANLAGLEGSQHSANPKRKIEETRLTSLEENLAEVEQVVRGEILESLLGQLSQLLVTMAREQEGTQERVKQFKEMVDEYNVRVVNTTDQYSDLENLKRKAEETRGILMEVRKNIGTITVESNAPTRIRITDEAKVPGDRPDYTPRIMIMVVAFGASVGLALLLAFWKELTDQQVRSSQDLARLTKLPIITTIPHAREDSLPKTAKLALLTIHMPLSTLADAYRQVLARVLHPDMERSDIKSLVVVSPTRGDGKSSLTCNLGAALAQAGRRVLLVDLSYRRPTLEKLLELPESEGLAEILNDVSPAEDIIKPSSVENLFVLGPGLNTSDLAGRLASRRMFRFLAWAEKEYDQIILDTPPWLIMADAKLITPLAGGVLVVVGSRVSTLGMVRRCLRELKEAKANVVGVVLNGARRTAGGYMSKNRNLYYHYGKNDGFDKGAVGSKVAATVASGSIDPETDA